MTTAVRALAGEQISNPAMMRYETDANLCSHRFTSASHIALVFFTMLVSEDLNPESFNFSLLSLFSPKGAKSQCMGKLSPTQSV